MSTTPNGHDWIAGVVAEVSKPEHLVGQVHARVGRTTRDKDRGTLLAYIDARTVGDAFDKAAGAGHWSTAVLKDPEPVMATDKNGVPYLKGFTATVRITITAPDGTSTYRTDSGFTDARGSSDYGMAIKGSVSDALKRAAAQFGLGRPLYELESPWIDVSNGYPDREQAEAVVRWWEKVLMGENVAPPQSGNQRPAQGGQRPAQDSGGSSSGSRAPSDRPGGRKPSDKQLKFLADLIAEARNEFPDVEKWMAAMYPNANGPQDLTGEQVSDLIDRLKNREYVGNPGGGADQGDDIPF